METEDRRGVKAFDTGLQVLTAFIGADSALSLTTLARRAGLHPAKVHRYLVSLCRSGYVWQDSASGQYRLANAALRLGFAAQRASDVVREAKPYLAQLCETTQQSAMLALWGENGPFVAAQELVPGPVAITAFIGSSLPLLRSSSGQTFGAWLPAARTERLLELELEEIRAGAISDLPSSQSEATALLGEIRRRGLARVKGRLNPSIGGISAPIFGPSDDIVAALTVMGPIASFDLGWTGTTAKSLHAVACGLSERLGAWMVRGPQ